MPAPGSYQPDLCPGLPKQGPQARVPACRCDKKGPGSLSPSRAKSILRVQEGRSQATGRDCIPRTPLEGKRGFVGRSLQQQDLAERASSRPSSPVSGEHFPNASWLASGRGLMAVGECGGLCGQALGETGAPPPPPRSGRSTKRISIAKAPDKGNVWLCLLWGLSILPGA